MLEFQFLHEASFLTLPCAAECRHELSTHLLMDWIILELGKSLDYKGSEKIDIPEQTAWAWQSWFASPMHSLSSHKTNHFPNVLRAVSNHHCSTGKEGVVIFFFQLCNLFIIFCHLTQFHEILSWKINLTYCECLKLVEKKGNGTYKQQCMSFSAGGNMCNFLWGWIPVTWVWEQKSIHRCKPRTMFGEKMKGSETFSWG